ncbi:unnamed protein product [Lota lota]
MRSAVIPTIAIICGLTASFSVATETVVGVAGRRVTLPCSSEAVSKGGVCWGRGKPSLFTCHNTLLVTNGVQVTHSASYRYRLPSDASTGDVSLFIYNTRQADSGFYHCRVQVPGLFNDQIYTVHLIVTEGKIHYGFARHKAILYNQTKKPCSTLYSTEESGSGEAWDNIVDPVVALVKTSQSDFQLSSPWSFIGNTLRMAVIIFIPALLLTISYRLMRSQQRPWIGRRILSDQEENSL